MKRPQTRYLPIAAMAVAVLGCSASATNDPGGGGAMTPPGGPVDGPADRHCDGVAPRRTSMSVCQAHAATATTTDDGPAHDGTGADDDDCKYHVTWSSTEIYE